MMKHSCLIVHFLLEIKGNVSKENRKRPERVKADLFSRRVQSQWIESRVLKSIVY